VRELCSGNKAAEGNDVTLWTFPITPQSPTIIVICRLLWLSKGMSVLLTYQEALAKLGSRYRVRKAVSKGALHHIGRGIYSTSRSEDTLAVIAKRYPDAILTGQTALYAHGLVTTPPDRIDLATKRGGTKVRNAAIRQHFIPAEWLNVGKSTVLMDGAELAAYDPERMLLELIRSRNKLPYDLYREAVASFRKRAEQLDIYRMQDYAEAIPRGEAHLERAMEEVF